MDLTSHSLNGGDSGATPLRRLFGLAVASELDLPLPIALGAAAVTVRRGLVEPSGKLLHRNPSPDTFACFCDGESVILDWPAARFSVDRVHVVVDSTDEAMATTLLLHPVWSVVQAARGVEALHGCVVEQGGRAVAIQGRSGFGKTTAGVALLDRGWRLVTDDLILFDEAGAVVPGPPFVRLAPDRSVGLRGRPDPGGKIRLFPPTCPVPVPLTALVVLVEGAGVGIRRLAGLEAVDALLTQIYNPIMTHPGQSRRRLDLALAVVARTPVFAAPPRSLTGDQLERLIEEAAP